MRRVSVFEAVIPSSSPGTLSCTARYRTLHEWHPVKGNLPNAAPRRRPRSCGFPRSSGGRRDANPGRPGLACRCTRDEIVRTAIAIADREGAEAISMRRIAHELHAGNMSIYWYVASRDELLALMIDAVEGEFDIPRRPVTGAPILRVRRATSVTS